MAKEAKKVAESAEAAVVKNAAETENAENTENVTAAEVAVNATVAGEDVTTGETAAEGEAVYAKAGKKSKKHVEAVKAEEERQERKLERAAADAVDKPKGEVPKTRPRLERRGKKYQATAKLIEKDKAYGLKEAVDLLLKTNPARFDASVEMHVRLGVDPRQADQNIRATLVLPNGNGKTVRVAVFAPEDVCKTALTAGADLAADEDFLKQLEKGVLNFDVLIAPPAYMPKLGKYARLLGPKGLMPNPKAGTVTNDIEKAVKEAKAGKVEYRVDKQSIVHLGVGKVSFGADKLLTNIEAFLNSLKAQKPASLKGTYVKSVYLTTTMGPSIQVENIYN